MLRSIIIAFIMVFTVGAESLADISAVPGRIKINRGSRYTRSSRVTLHIAGFNVSKMKVSNYPDFRDAHWIGYMPKVYGWNLLDQEGERTVYVKFRGFDGKEQEVISDKIKLDKTAPKNPKVTIDVEGGFINDPNQTSVDLKIECEDATYMMVSNSKSFFRKRWQLYRPEIKDWELSKSVDSEKMIFMKFRDKAGNVSKVTYDRVKIDTQGPLRTGVIIENDAEFTTKADNKVMVTCLASDVKEMRLSNEKDFSDEAAKWMAYERKIEWQLKPGDGEKKVFVQYKDPAGNISDPVYDSIIVDTTPPGNCLIKINEGDEVSRNSDRVVELTISTDEKYMMMVSNNENFTGSYWVPFTDLITDWVLAPGRPGERSVYVKFKDEAANVSKAYSDDIMWSGR